MQAMGNWGLFDQLMALEFVKENIKAFRGDPDRITLAGDGAGAISVGIQLVSDMTRDKPRSKYRNSVFLLCKFQCFNSVFTLLMCRVFIMCLCIVFIIWLLR